MMKGKQTANIKKENSFFFYKKEIKYFEWIA